MLTTSDAQTFTLSNTGASTPVIAGITASGDFKATNTCGASLAVGSGCQISVTFTPTAMGTRIGTVTVADNAADTPQSVALSGNGIAPFVVGAASGSSTTATITSGDTATYNITVTGVTGFTGTVTLSCAGASQYSSCTVSPSSVTLTSGASAGVTVSVTTAKAKSAMVTGTSTLLLAGMGPASLFSIPFHLSAVRQKRRWIRFAWTLLALGLAVASGCGGGSSGGGPQGSPGTPAGTYTLTLTATSGTATATQTLKLMVQ